MKKKNIETDFIRFIIEEYSPSPGATASKDNDEKSSGATASKNGNEKSPDAQGEDEDGVVVEKLLLENIHKIQMLDDRIRTNRKKLSIEKDSKKRQILNLQIWIDQYQIRVTRLKAN